VNQHHWTREGASLAYCASRAEPEESSTPQCTSLHAELRYMGLAAIKICSTKVGKPQLTTVYQNCGTC